VDLKEKKVGTPFPNGCHIAEVEIEPETGIAEMSATSPATTRNIITTRSSKARCRGITQGAGHIFAAGGL